MRTLKAAAAYFGWVFAAGFLFGAIRTLWVVPVVGVRYAELMESPIMFVVTILAARQIVRRGLAHPLAVGGIALGFLLIAEIATAVGVRHLSLHAYIATRDPVSGTVYLVLLAAFTVMPRVLSHGNRKAGSGNDPLAHCVQD